MCVSFCRDVVDAIIDSDDWVEALRHAHPDKDHTRRSKKDRPQRNRSVKGAAHCEHEQGSDHQHGGEHYHTLTPLRMMIRKMPSELVRL